MESLILTFDFFLKDKELHYNILNKDSKKSYILCLKFEEAIWKDVFDRAFRYKKCLGIF